jgi:methionyl-tRNA formyltransferase
VPLLKPENINQTGVRDAVRAWPAEAWVVIAFGQKLGAALLADRFAINLHASLLPRWRGAAPINHAVLAGDAHTGNSVITLAERMDAGLVLGRSRRPIGPGQTAGELHDLLAQDGPELVGRVLHEHAQGRLAPETQDESGVTAAGKLAKSDGRIEWNEDADVIRRRINAFSPWPGVTATHDGQALKLLRAEPGTPVAESNTPGAVVDPGAGLVACGGGTSVIIGEVQPAGKKAMSFEAWANGRQIKAGEMLGSSGATA